MLPGRGQENGLTARLFPEKKAKCRGSHGADDAGLGDAATCAWFCQGGLDLLVALRFPSLRAQESRGCIGLVPNICV